jgi:hypothetical protein
VKRWQTADNAAIVGLLTHLLRAGTVLASREGRGWAARIERANALVERLLRAEPVRHVAPDPYWARHQVSPSLLAKSQFYRSLWRYAHAWRDAATTRDSAALRSVLAGGWLASENDDQMFELFVLSRLVETLHRLGPWHDFSICPPTSESETILEACQDDLEFQIRYDRAPPVAGAYSWLFRRYSGVDASARRPDLQITVRQARRSTQTLVEVKATTPNSDYGRDSVYKVLGYLKDYAPLWASEKAITYPRALVVFTSAVVPTVPRSQRVAGDELVLSSHELLDADLEAIVIHLATDVSAM